jgi:hypothetical protein
MGREISFWGSVKVPKTLCFHRVDLGPKLGYRRAKFCESGPADWGPAFAGYHIQPGYRATAEMERRRPRGA